MFRALEDAAQNAANGDLYEDEMLQHLVWLHQRRQKARVARDFVLSDEFAKQMTLLGVNVLELDRELAGAMRSRMQNSNFAAQYGSESDMADLQRDAARSCTCDGGGSLCRACQAEKKLKDLLCS